MKSIKKFSAMSAKDQPITEGAKVTKEAVDELIKKIGFDSIEELKKEKDLLSKLEAMSKTFAKSNDISEDEIEEDRAEDIEDEVKAKGTPKSLEGTEDKEGDEEVVASGEEEVEEDRAEDIEDEVLAIGKTKSLEDKEGDEVTPDQEITKEVPDAASEVTDEDGVDVEDDDSENEEVETPKATRRIMAFEDFVKEKEETINKNIKYHDDDEEPEDYSVPVADSKDPLAEAKVNEDDDDDDDEEKGSEDERKGDELEDKGDKKVDDEDDKEKEDHYKGAVKSDDEEIDALKKDVKYDKEEEEDDEKNESTIMSFSTFVNEAYDKVVWGGDKGDKSKTHDGEDYEDEEDESANEKYDKVTLGGNKGDKSKTHDGEDYEDEDEKKDEAANEKYDKVTLGGNKGDKSKTHDGEDYEDEDKTDEKYDDVTLGGNKGDKSKTHDGEDYEDEDEKKDEAVTETEETAAKALAVADDAKAMASGSDGVVIPEVKGDGSETAAGIAAGIMAKGKVKDLSKLAGKLVTPDQKVTEVIPDEANDVSEDGIEIPLVKEDVLPDDSIAEKFRKLATNKLGKVNEAEITTDEQFKEYAEKLLKDAHGKDYDEKKATSVIEGLLSKYSGDYGAMVGALQSSIG